MNTQIILLLCEGPHDAAFLRKILRANGFNSYDGKKIKEYPTPMNAFVKRNLEKSNIEDLNIQEAKKAAFIPNNVLQKENTYLFSYILGGATKMNRMNDFLINMFKLTKKDEKSTEYDVAENTDFAVLCFFDADNDMKIIDKNIKDSLKNEGIDCVIEEEVHKCIKYHKGLKIGFYIFTEDDHNTGKLEDIILPLMRKDNEDVFSVAEEYINKFSKKADKDKDKGKKIIGVTGQLEKPGCENTVHIRQTSYITDEKIKANSKCQEILNYIEDFIKE